MLEFIALKTDILTLYRNTFYPSFCDHLFPRLRYIIIRDDLIKYAEFTYKVLMNLTEFAGVSKQYLLYTCFQDLSFTLQFISAGTGHAQRMMHTRRRYKHFGRSRAADQFQTLLALKHQRLRMKIPAAKYK